MDFLNLYLITLSEIGNNKEKLDLINSLKDTLQIVNLKLDSHERIHRVVVLHEEWTIENSLLTPTMKIKRKSIEKIYKENYVFWYDSEHKIFFTDEK